MNNAPKKDEDDLPTLADSDVELVSGPQLPELTDSDIENALSEDRMKAEGSLEQAKAEKSNEMLARIGNEIVGTDMKHVFEKGGDIGKALAALKNKFIEQGANIDKSKSRAELTAILNGQLDNLKRGYDEIAGKGDRVAKRIAGDIESYLTGGAIGEKIEGAAADIRNPKAQEMLSRVKNGEFPSIYEFQRARGEMIDDLMIDVVNPQTGATTRVSSKENVNDFQILDNLVAEHFAQQAAGPQAPDADEKFTADDEIDNMLSGVG